MLDKKNFVVPGPQLCNLYGTHHSGVDRDIKTDYAWAIAIGFTTKIIVKQWHLSFYDNVCQSLNVKPIFKTF